MGTFDFGVAGEHAPSALIAQRGRVRIRCKNQRGLVCQRISLCVFVY